MVFIEAVNQIVSTPRLTATLDCPDRSLLPIELHARHQRYEVLSEIARVNERSNG